MSSSYGVADLAVIKYGQVLKRDPKECHALLEACERWGFFYLDLRQNNECKDYFALTKDLLDFSKQYFSQSIEEKMCDKRDDFATFNICGYKPMALDTGNVQSKKDGCEGLRIPSDLCHSVTGNPTLSIPSGAESRWSTISAFNNQSHQIASHLLSSLSDSMGLIGPNRYECYHVADRSSTTTTVLQHYPHRDDLDNDISVGHFTHTDTRSITILFNTEWGLQVHSPYSDAWEWIPPHPDYAIVNIGDTLRFMSNKRLRSSLHRVVPAVENWTSGSRYATIFFLRANNDAQFVDSEGRSWRASDWLMRKFGGYRQTHAVQATTPVSTGKTGFVGLWEDRATKPNEVHPSAQDDVMDRTAWKNLMWSSASY